MIGVSSLVRAWIGVNYNYMANDVQTMRPSNGLCMVCLALAAQKHSGKVTKWSETCEKHRTVPMGAISCDGVRGACVIDGFR